MHLIQPSSLKSRRKHALRLDNRGVSLVEVLVTVLVSSVGLLGIAALHLASLRNNYDSTIRTQASMLASDITDRIRSNRTAALQTTSAYAINFGATYSSPTTQAQRDVAQWKSALAVVLPSGDGQVTVDTTTHLATIVIKWSERGTETPTFTTMTEL